MRIAGGNSYLAVMDGQHLKKFVIVMNIILNINYGISFSASDNPNTPRPCTSWMTNVADPRGDAGTRQDRVRQRSPSEVADNLIFDFQVVTRSGTLQLTVAGSCGNSCTDTLANLGK